MDTSMKVWKSIRMVVDTIVLSYNESKQRVKLGDKYRDWLCLSKGVP